MGTSIKDILDGNSFAEPEEIRIIKNYVFEHFQSECGVSVSSQSIIIKVSSSALAGTLRMYLQDLQKKCKTDKKLVIRIGR
ncbi:hypothetical protein KDA00_03125 [Candidatus Saccharibacteria bacterium]|nr:hypothetical protein [Candidatus Saccharibacteria bacterium]